MSETYEPIRKVAIICSKGSLDMAYPGLILANAARMSGIEAVLFFTFWGLNVLKKENQFAGKTVTAKMLAAMMPAGAAGTSRFNMLGIGPAFFKFLMRKKKVASLEELLALAVEMDVRMIACTTSMELMGIQREELIDGIEIGGVATYLQDACDSRATLFI